MKALRVAKDIVPIAEFKAQSATWLDHVRESGQPVIITQNGKPAAVMISPDEFDRIQHQNIEFIRGEISAAQADITAGRTMESKDVRAFLKERRNKRK